MRRAVSKIRRGLVLGASFALLGTGLGIRHAEPLARGKPLQEAKAIYEKKAIKYGVGGLALGVGMGALSAGLPNGRSGRRGKKKQVFTG